MIYKNRISARKKVSQSRYHMSIPLIGQFELFKAFDSIDDNWKSRCSPYDWSITFSAKLYQPRNWYKKGPIVHKQRRKTYLRAYALTDLPTDIVIPWNSC